MRKKITRRTLEGMAKAQRNCEKWSGGCWALQASEYLLTTNIVQDIARISANEPFTCQATPRFTNDAGGVFTVAFRGPTKFLLHPPPEGLGGAEPGQATGSECQGFRDSLRSRRRQLRPRMLRT